VHGRPVADIVPRRERSERRLAVVVYSELNELRTLADELRLRGRTHVSDYDAALTSDDF
jgi:antitoxin (DNA-binding transcriptional repressor) of toxin-antitoxin stability system